MLFHLQTLYLVPRYNPINDPSADDLDPRSNFPPKWVKNKELVISVAISPTDFILSTKVQLNRSHSMTLMPMSLTLGQDQIFPKMGKKPKNLSYLGGYFTFILGTKVQPNKSHSMTQVSMPLTFGQSQGQIFPKMHKKTKNWSYLGGYFTYRLHSWYQGTTK